MAGADIDLSFIGRTGLLPYKLVELMSTTSPLFALDTTVAISGGGATLSVGMARGLLAAGARVAVWSRRAETVERALAELSSPKSTIGIIADAGSPEAIARALQETEDRLGSPEVLINAVGGNLSKGPFTEIDIEVFRETIDLNLIAGCVLPTKLIASYWIERGLRGSIINIASLTSYKPLSGVWAYGAAKAGVMNITEATAKEFAPHGIRVNAIAPGFFLAEQNRRLLVNELTGQPTERGREVLSRTPFGRFGTPEELSGTAIFLASEAASGFVTGATIPVDGGFLVDNV